jgi:glyoxylase-like metal-dependent hydrolase (beta-lactamase superfamily II)
MYFDHAVESRRSPVPLQYEVVVAPMQRLPEAAGVQPPGGPPAAWSPLSSTLVYGATEVVLVDPPITAAQARRVADRVAATGRELRAIYVTHGHGDHWFGTAALLRSFPGTGVYATEGVIAQMRRASPDGQPSPLFAALFPGQIPETPVLARPVPEAGLLVDGQALVPVEVGHSDTDDSTVLHVPSIDLVVAGDVIYNNVHQYLAESAGGGLQAWLRAVDQVQALHPRHVVAGHKDDRRPDDPLIIAETRAYLQAAGELLATRPTRRGYLDGMLARFPQRLNPTMAWLSALRLLPDGDA